MATSKAVFKRIVALLESGKITETEGHRVLNGAKITHSGQTGTYQNGNLVLGAGVVPISPDRITSVIWPSVKTLAPVKAPAAKAPAPPAKAPAPKEGKQLKLFDKKGGSGL